MTDATTSLTRAEACGVVRRNIEPYQLPLDAAPVTTCLMCGSIELEITTSPVVHYSWEGPPIARLVPTFTCAGCAASERAGTATLLRRATTSSVYVQLMMNQFSKSTWFSTASPSFFAFSSARRIIQ